MLKTETYSRLKAVGFPEGPEVPAQRVIDWLNHKDLLRIEPYWRYLGANGGFSWTKSWDQFSEPIEVPCETWEELLEKAVEISVQQAL